MNKLLKFTSFFVPLLLATWTIFVPLAHASYNASYLLSDSLLRDTSNFSASDIQSFLVSKNSGLATYSDFELCGSPSGSHFAYYNQFYDCNVDNGDGTMRTNPKPASQIIYDTAQAYGISAKVLLATMQKEQSLVTDPDPTQSTLNCAMGYYSCGAYTNFFSQVDGGSWQFRTYYELMNGNNWWGYTPSSYPCARSSSLYSTGLYQGSTVTFADPAQYDAQGNLVHAAAPRTITLASSATAALYCYTPYVGPISDTGYSGSYNFVTSYEQWFGSSITGGCLGTESPLPYVQRFYNPRTFEHFYSAYTCDEGFLFQLGYVNEGPVFNTTSNGLKTAVYRYYNPATGQHMWSTTLENNSQLAADGAGYELDNSGQPVFYVDSPSDPNAIPVYRFYNPNDYLHLWASSAGLTVTDLGTISQAGYTLESPVFYTQ